MPLIPKRLTCGTATVFDTSMVVAPFAAQARRRESAKILCLMRGRRGGTRVLLTWRAGVPPAPAGRPRPAVPRRGILGAMQYDLGKVIVKKRARLPHWHAEHAIYFITWN